jgi:cytochrome P450
MTMAARPPGPRGHWLLGSLPEIQRDMPQALLDVTRRYGGITRLRMGPVPMYLVADGDLIVEMLAKRPDEFRKSNRTYASLRGHLGRGLVTLEGDEHRRHRRLMQPVMHTRSVAAQAQTMVDLTRRQVRAWPDGSRVRLLDEMADLTLRIVCSALFRLDDDAEAEDLVGAVHEFAGSLNVTLRQAFPLPGWLPTRANRLRRASVRRVDELAYRLIRRRRASGADGGDLLSLLLSAEDAGRPGLSDVEVRDELLTMFFAGHETSAAALTWAWYLLGEHPSVAADLRAEIDAVVGSRDVGMADLPNLPRLGRVVKETLRLYPPAWVFDRSPRHDLVLGGYAIPKGANVLFSPWVVHRDPRHWDAPAEFRPDRFAGAAPPRAAYLPFGDGPRICLGNRFAEAEISLVLATMLPMVDLSRVDSGPVRPRGDATLRPDGGLDVRVTTLTS